MSVLNNLYNFLVQAWNVAWPYVSAIPSTVTALIKNENAPARTTVIAVAIAVVAAYLTVRQLVKPSKSSK